MRRIAPLLVWLQLLLICGCSSLDCPLNSTVYCRYVLAGPVTTLPDTLTVSTVPEGKSDPVLLNRWVEKSDFILPMSYVHPVDVLFFTFTNSTGSIRDTVRISKLDQSHFESIDCTPAFFHTLTSVEHTTHAIDSIIINKSKVTYDTTGGNLRIYLKSRD